MAARRRATPGSFEYPGAWESIRRTYVALKGECARTMAPFGLLYSEYRSLTVIRAGPVTPGYLARDLGLTPAAASGIVARLRRRGWVTTRAHPEDRRARWVELTAEGRRLEARARRVWILRLRTFSDDLSLEDAAALSRGIAAVAAVLSARNERGRSRP